MESSSLIKIKHAVITDANILIDYADTEKKVISLFAEAVESLYVPLKILKEVPKLNLTEAKKLGLKLLDTEIDILAEASNMREGCSFNDKICFLTARKEGFICATNDRRLRKVCKDGGVETLWGLQIILYLVQEKKLSGKEAVEIARKISKINSTITRDLVEDFERKVKEVEKK